jgi:YfiR/HmsC-like
LFDPLKRGHTRASAYVGILVLRLQCKKQNRLSATGRLSRGLLCASATLFLLLISLPLPAQNFIPLEYRAKANYLANFPSFVEWPPEAWPQEKGPFLVCVLGDFPFGTFLAEITRGTTVRNRPVEIRWIRKPQELSSCQILFVSHSEQKRYSQVLDAVRDHVVLTVGEAPEFLDAGGIVSFFTQQGALQFDVNLEAADKAHLKISSRLLALARHVVNRTEAAKS